MSLRALRIETPKKTLKVAIDGEVARMAPPLRFAVRAGALRVIAPPAPSPPAPPRGRV